MRHLIHTDDLERQEIAKIFQKALSYKHNIKHNLPTHKPLRDKNVITIFFENSTRTLSSFELAVKNLGGNVLRLDVSRSSTNKGETISDTAANLDAMHPHAIIMRHSNAGAPYYLARHIACPLINGGDGAHAHPTQALLDLLTIIEHFEELEYIDFEDAGLEKIIDSKKISKLYAPSLESINIALENIKGKKIAIVGDIINSRVANSNIALLKRFGLDITLVAPPHFLPKTTLKTSHNLQEVALQMDIIMSLRTQTERHNHIIYGSLKDYAHKFCITNEVLGAHECIILHPGPVHRNIDISDEILQDSRSKVLAQVQNGLCLRMAIMEFFITNT